MRMEKRSGEQGAALICTLMVIILLTTLGAGLTFMTVTETVISANYRIARETFYAADAALQRAMSDLRTVPDWNDVLAAPPGNLRSGFDDGLSAPTAPDGTTLDVEALTAALQADTAAGYAGPADEAPSWRVFAQGNLGRVVAEDGPALGYVIVWVADDAADNDHDPVRDANRRLLVHAAAFGSATARRDVEAVVARAAVRGGGPWPVRLVSWRRVR